MIPGASSAIVEREFITIGEALTQLSQRDQPLFREIKPAPQIISYGSSGGGRPSLRRKLRVQPLPGPSTSQRGSQWRQL